MPVNTSSTGATYGKSSDPLCPLGFHPQVRWPTRCKRCFRDYKEHSDDKDRARHAGAQRATGNADDSDPWSTGVRTGFQKSRSMDVTQLSDTRSRLGAAAASAQSSQRPNLIGAEIGAFSSRVTSTSGATSSTTQPQVSQTDDDIPEWKRAMLERQAARTREAAAYATPSASSAQSTSQHSSYGRPSSVTEDNRLSSSTKSTPSTASTNKPSQPAPTSKPPSLGESSTTGSRFRRAESEDQTLSTSFRSRKSLSFEEPESTSRMEDGASRNRRLEESAKSSTSKVTFSEPAKPESKPTSYNSWSSSKSSTTPESSSYTTGYNTTQATSSTSSKATTQSTKPDTKPATPPTPKSQSTPSWKTATKTTPDSSAPSTPDKPVPSWKKPAAPATPNKVEKVEEKTPSWKTPSWKQQKETKTEEVKPKLGNITESKPSSSKSTLATKPKSSFSDSLETNSPYSAKKDTDLSSNYTPSVNNGSGVSNSYSESSAGDTAAKQAKLKSLESEVEGLKTQVGKLERSNSTLRREKDALEINKGRTTPTNITYESAKASETASELLKSKEQIRDQERSLSKLETEKKGLSLRTKELETQLERRPVAAETNKTIIELQTKLKYFEKKSHDLETENNDLQSNVQNLEQEMEEVQDNFKEDEVDEYRHLKRDLETASKNCRVLQFKLKKAEKTLIDLNAEKSDLEHKVKTSAGGSGAIDNMSKIRQLEKELDNKNQLNSRLEQQIKELQNNPGSKKTPLGKGVAKTGPVMSRTGSVERSVEDQLLKDLQDSIERENDLKEQLNMADDSSTDSRKKMSRLEDENESLANQLKRMTNKTKVGSRRSPSPRVGGALDKDEGISEDGEELSPAELKVQLEVSEGETDILRKKVDNLLTDNLKLSKDIKDINTRLADEKKKKPSSSLYSSSASTSDKASAKIDEIQNELNDTRVKLIEKDRELERLDAQLKSVSKGSGSGRLKRSGSQDEDLSKKLEVIEKEANVLRSRNTSLESENEKLNSDNKQLHQKYGKKPPSSTNEKLQMDKFSLEEKCRVMEAKEREHTREIEKLQLSTKAQKNDTIEIDKLKREKANIEYELTKIKTSTESEKRKVERLEKEVTASTEKSEKAQRELISAEREKRKIEDEKMRMEDKYGRLESELRQTTRERDRNKEECDSIKQKNRDNLAQTQDGVKAFKDQIETFKKDLQDEKTKHRDTRKTTDDKARQFQTDMRTVKQELDEKSSACSDLEFKVADLDDKWSKSKRINQQRKEKIDTLEKQLEDEKTSSNKATPELSNLRTKVRDLETDLENKSATISELEKSANNSPKKTWGSSTSNGSKLETENADLKKEVEELKKKTTTPASTWGRQNSSAEVEKELLKQELEDTVSKHELLEEEYVVAKAKVTMERDEIKADHDKMKNEYGTIKSELATLRKTYNTKSDDWIKEKLNQQQRMKDLEDSLSSSDGGGGWESERDRFKNIIEDRDNQLTQLKIEGDVAHSQVSAQRKDIEELKLKLLDYEKMNKFQKVVSSDDKTSIQEKQKFDELKKQLTTEQKERKTETNNIKMKYDSKTALMNEEIMALKSQCSKYKRERETYKEMMESAQKSRSGRTSAAGDEASEYKQRVNDLTYQMQVLEDELGDAKLNCSKVNASSMAQRSNYEIAIAELNSKINELEEESLIESGRARIAGTRTKMELAWQKERESQKKLINELNTMSRDLKSTLVEVEKNSNRERLESKRKIDGMKTAFSDENDDTKKQITDLQYDLLELRDAHAKLRTTNEKLRREKEKSGNERDEYKIMVKERSRGEQGEDKKVGRLLGDMSEFLSEIPKLVGDDIMAPPKPGRTIPHTILDARAKESLAAALKKIKDAKEELEQIHKHNEEERERINARRAMMKRTGSVETDQDSPRGMRGGSKGRSNLPNVPEIGPGRRLSRRTGSIGDTIVESDALWKSTDSRGSNESLASNASIPLPVPVRTRSAHGGGGNESGYSSDTYNAMSIRRLERDTSIDRLSTGSRESNRSAFSTASEFDQGKKKKAGLIGKLKKLTRKSEDKEFGSGSDISNVGSDISKTSVASSAMSAFQKVQQKRSASKDRSSSKDRSKLKEKTPEESNAPFDKYFPGVTSQPNSRGRATDKSTPTTLQPFGPSTSSASNSSTLPRSSYTRRY